MSTEDIGNEEEYEEVDVLSLLAAQSEEEEDEVEEDESDDVDVLRERISKRNRALRKKEKAIERMQQEYDAVVERLEKLENAPPKPQGGTVDRENQEREAQEWIDRVADDPVNAIKYTDKKQAQFEERVAAFLGDKLGQIEQMIQSLDGRTNPERVKYEQEIETLRRLPEFRDKSDEELIPVAKVLKSSKVKSPRGVVNGRKVAQTQEKKFELTDEVKQAMGF